MSSSVPVCTFLPFSLHKFSLYSTALGFPTFHTSTQLPPYPSRVASLLFSASFPSSKGISSSGTDSMRSLHSSHSGETEMLPQGKLALLLGPAFRGGGDPPRTDVTWVPGSTQGSPHLIPQLSQLLAFDSPQVRAEETEPHRE